MRFWCCLCVADNVEEPPSLVGGYAGRGRSGRSLSLAAARVKEGESAVMVSRARRFELVRSPAGASAAALVVVLGSGVVIGCSSGITGILSSSSSMARHFSSTPVPSVGSVCLTQSSSCG